MLGPRVVEWSDHALIKARVMSASRADIEDGLFVGHPRRTRNRGAADWQVGVGPWVVAYDHPADDDATKARIVTLWRP
jgi:hypothetical protein